MTMVDASLKVGEVVCLTDTQQRARVLEVDHRLLIARLELDTGVETWELLDDLEEVEVWDKQNIGGE